MASTRPNPIVVDPRLHAPVTLEGAEAALSSLFRARRDLFMATPPENTLRGIDFYKPQDLPTVFRQAANNFYRAHERLPNLVQPTTTVDRFFMIKFFDPIPLPIPADKLNAPLYAPEPVLRRIGVPKRPWQSETPRLPEDDAVPAGRYYFKISTGNAMQSVVDWPPTPEERERLERLARHWAGRRYGLSWGEWWYSYAPPRFFLEEDLSSRLSDRSDCKVMVRDGRARIFHTTRKTEKSRYFRHFSRDTKPLSAALLGHLLDEPKVPKDIDLMISAAEQIGSKFKTVRVDFLNLRDEPPMLGELTLCHVNALWRFKSPSDDPLIFSHIYGDAASL